MNLEDPARFSELDPDGMLERISELPQQCRAAWRLAQGLDLPSAYGAVQQSLALELAEYGVRVNAVCSGNLLDSPLWVDSLYKQYAEKWGITEEKVRQRYIDQVPVKRGCTYDDVANLVVFLASDQASYMTGQALNVTGGQEMG